MKRTPRRIWAAVVVVLSLAVAGCSTAAPAPVTTTHAATSQGTSLPAFADAGEITEAADLKYAPTGEFIFPSVFHAGEYLKHPLAEWYLYYAPHEKPGGISFLYSNSLTGPWTEYSANPIVSNVWKPYYSVSHASSPDVLWNPQAGKVFLYFHGENSTTRYATSDDGVHFGYGGVALDAPQLEAGSTEVSYARIFPNPSTSSSSRYAMFFMENTTKDVRRIRVAYSTDGRTWNARPDPLLEPTAAEKNLSGANLVDRGGQFYIVYHASDGVIYDRTIDKTLTNLGPRHVLFRSTNGTRSAAADIVTNEGKTYLFYESGPRLQSTIRYATAVPGSE